MDDQNKERSEPSEERDHKEFKDHLRNLLELAQAGNREAFVKAYIERCEKRYGKDRYGDDKKD
jgi:hypothetical protein